MLLSQLSIHAWIQEHQIKTETGKPLDFHRHRYLFDIYSDNSPKLCCKKAGQIGFSTMAIIKTIWLSLYKKIDIGYILPTVEMVQKFVGSKVNRLAQQNPVIQECMKDKDSITQKQIGESYVHYLGAQTERSAIMISLDMLVADEYNKAPQNILETYDSRLQHSTFGYKWIFSNPTIPDFGVDKFFDISDQKKLNVVHSCGNRFILDERCIDYLQEMYKCPMCHEEITDEERRMGEWYNKDDVKWSGKIEGDYEWSGWWIPLWLNPDVPASKIAEAKRTKSKEYFANFVCGDSYVSPNDAVSEQALLKCLSREINSQENRTIIGLDTGHNLHYVLMNKQGIFYHGYCPSVEEMPTEQQATYDPYDEIEKRLKEFPRSILMSDQGGDLIGIRKLQAKYRGRVFLCWSNKESKTQELVRWGEDEEYGKVLIDRNRTIQLIVDEINEQRLVFNGTREDWQPYFNHWLNMYRTRKILDENEPLYGWKWEWRRKGADHWALATVYGMVGLDQWGGELAQVIKKDAFFKPHTGTTRLNTISGKRMIKRLYKDAEFV